MSLIPLGTEIVKAIGRPIETACNLLEAVLGQPCEAVGGLLTDQIHAWQWKRRIAILEEAESILARKGIASRVLPPAFAIPFLRESGDSADENLQTAWANLLASAVESDQNCHIGFVHTLKQLSPADALVLAAMFELGPVPPSEQVDRLADATGLEREIVVMSFADFERLGFFTPTRKRLKSFAFHFARACFENHDAIELYREKQGELPTTPIAD